MGIAQRQRPQDGVVDGLVDGVEAPVHPLEGILDGQGVGCGSGLGLDDRRPELGMGGARQRPQRCHGGEDQPADGAVVGPLALHSGSLRRVVCGCFARA